MAGLKWLFRRTLLLPLQAEWLRAWKKNSLLIANQPFAASGRELPRGERILPPPMEASWLRKSCWKGWGLGRRGAHLRPPGQNGQWQRLCTCCSSHPCTCTQKSCLHSRKSKKKPSPRYTTREHQWLLCAVGCLSPGWKSLPSWLSPKGALAVTERSPGCSLKDSWPSPKGAHSMVLEQLVSMADKATSSLKERKHEGLNCVNLLCLSLAFLYRHILLQEAHYFLLL